MQSYSNLISIETVKEAFFGILNKIERNTVLDIRNASIPERCEFEIQNLLFFNLLQYFFEELKEEINLKICSISELLSGLRQFAFLNNTDHRKIYVSVILNILNCPLIINNIKEQFLISILETLEHLFNITNMKQHKNLILTQQNDFIPPLFTKLKKLKKLQKLYYPQLPISHINELKYYKKTVQKHSKNLLHSRRRMQRTTPSLENQKKQNNLSQNQSLIIISKIESLETLKLSQKLFYNLQNPRPNTPRLVALLD
jgi:hypothetical protein